MDYSKFDHIDDSDEEPVSTSATKATVAKAPVRAPARGNSNAKETLEPTGLEDRFRILGQGLGQGPGDSAPDFAGLANELGLFSPPSRSAESAATNQQEAKPGEPKRLCVKADGRKKIHTTYADGYEMVEEFDERTDMLLVRKTRKASTLGGQGDWVYEVGQAPEAAFDPSSDLLKASASNPVFLRKDTPECFQWRVRNLPYKPEVYSVTVDHDKQQIVVRTSNKKYYKRIDVPDLQRLGLSLKDESLSWKHQHSTLIISYARPAEVTAAEQEKLAAADKSAVKM